MPRLLSCAGLGILLLATLAAFGLTSGAQPAGATVAPYSYSDEVAFKFVDISTTGTLMDITDDDDDYQSDVPFGFSFEFFGTGYTVVEVTTNGVFSFDQEQNDEYDNEPLSTAQWNGPTAFNWWDDLDPGECGDMYYETLGDAPNRVFIVQWNDVCHNDCSDCAPGEGVTIEAAFCETSNNLVFSYQDTFFGTGDPDLTEENNGGTATTGLQQGFKQYYLQYSHNQTVLTDGLAVVYYPYLGSPTNCTLGLNEEPTPEPTATDVGPPAPTNTPVPPGAPTVDLTVDDDDITTNEDVEVTAQVLDENGAPIEGVDCTFSIASQPGDDASVEPGPVTTDAEGNATTTLDTGSTEGTIEVQADCEGSAQVLAVNVGAGVQAPSTGSGGGNAATPVAVWASLAALIVVIAGAGTLSLARHR